MWVPCIKKEKRSSIKCQLFIKINPIISNKRDVNDLEVPIENLKVLLNETEDYKKKIQQKEEEIKEREIWDLDIEKLEKIKDETIMKITVV